MSLNLWLKHSVYIGLENNITDCLHCLKNITDNGYDLSDFSGFCFVVFFYFFLKTLNMHMAVINLAVLFEFCLLKFNMV